MKICIEPPGNISVIAPSYMKEEDIRQAIDGKSGWIIRKLKEIKESGIVKNSKDYSNGEIFMYLGRDCRLMVQSDKDVKKTHVGLVGDCLLVRTATEDPEKLKKFIEDWYRKESLDIVSERVEFYQIYFQHRPLDIRTKRQKSRWGSCSSAHRLNFNLRCAMAPLEIIDYIVVHEMCHMVHFNHSKEFWGLVEIILPDFKDRRAWLKKNGIRMIL